MDSGDLIDSQKLSEVKSFLEYILRDWYEETQKKGFSFFYSYFVNKYEKDDVRRR